MQGVLEVRGIEIDFVGGEDFELMLLEGNGGEGAAGEIVMDAAVQNSPPRVSSFFRSPSFVRQESGHRVRESGRRRQAF